jgi:hypothetical protein
MSRRGSAAAAFSLGVLITSASAAQGNTSDEEVTGEARSEREASPAVRASTMVPFTTSPSGGLTYGVVTSGFDGARNAVIYNAYADAKVYGGLSVRAGYASPDLAGRASALFGPRLQLLQQDRHGLDLGVALFYMPQNIYDEGLLTAKLSLGRSFGPMRVLMHVAYGQDPEGDDHQAEAAAATLYRLSDALFAGVDARVRALVATSDDKHAGLREPVLDLAAGPMLTYRFGMFAVVTQVGASALWMDRKPRVLPATQASTAGAFALLGMSLML